MQRAIADRHARGRSVESGPIRKVDVGDAKLLRGLVATLRTGVDTGDLDAEHCYAAGCLRQHVAARCRQVREERARSQARFTGDLQRLLEDLAAALQSASRLEDAVAASVVGGGCLDVLESATLRRLLDETIRLLDASRHRDIELSMRRHWVDLGEAG